MHRYFFGPFSISSEIEIPQLDRVEGSGTIAVRLIRAAVPPDLPEAAIFDKFCQVSEAAYLLDIPRVARFLVENGNTVSVDTATDAPMTDVCSFLLGSVFGALCHQNGLLPLHASAVEGARGVAAFLGNSGAGKSTLAACLQARGTRIVSDDICLLEHTEDGMRVVPVAGWVKLWRASMEHLGEQPEEKNRVFAADDKYRMFLDARTADRPRLRDVVVLTRAEAAGEVARLEPLSAAETLAAMMQMTYLAYVVELTGGQAVLFKRCAEVLNDAKGYRLVVPWGWEEMESVLDLVDAQLLS